MIPAMQIVNKARGLVLRRDDMEAAIRDTELRPCTTRQATQEECLLYGIKPGAGRQDKPAQQYRKRWA